MSIPFDSAFPETEQHPDSASQNAERISNANGTFKLTESFCGMIAPQATRYAMSITRVWADAEEVVQEAFCRLLQSDRCDNEHDETNDLAQQEDGTTPKAVLFATIRNLSIDRLRRQGRRRFEQIDTQQIAISKHTTSETKLNQLESEVQEIMKTLPTQWADAIELKVNGKLSYSEIASILVATHAQVRTWIFRARKQLEKDLQHKGLLDCGDES